YLSQTIDDFRNFIKGGDAKTLLNISLLFERTLSIIRPNLKSNYIEIVSDISKELSINGYENELMQAFINIINNSKDALVENKELGDKYIFIEAKLVNDKCEIIIKDNGGGIMQSAINRIFEPYFTTKHQSQGTGLGLSMTYKIITEKHEGAITASNVSYKYNEKEYVGACFKTIISIGTK
ncbi:MAG: HAMP domain-containing histidine kinase, partial [Arcobacter sp.]|nr:HAMP domain-containing histidine kinase [Arcobacter sp.]